MRAICVTNGTAYVRTGGKLGIYVEFGLLHPRCWLQLERLTDSGFFENLQNEDNVRALLAAIVESLSEEDEAA